MTDWRSLRGTRMISWTARRSVPSSARAMCSFSVESRALPSVAAVATVKDVRQLLEEARGRFQGVRAQLLSNSPQTQLAPLPPLSGGSFSAPLSAREPRRSNTIATIAPRGRAVTLNGVELESAGRAQRHESFRASGTDLRGSCNGSALGSSSGSNSRASGAFNAPGGDRPDRDLRTSGGNWSARGPGDDRPDSSGGNWSVRGPAGERPDSTLRTSSGLSTASIHSFPTGLLESLRPDGFRSSLGRHLADSIGRGLLGNPTSSIHASSQGRKRRSRGHRVQKGDGSTRAQTDPGQGAISDWVAAVERVLGEVDEGDEDDEDCPTAYSSEVSMAAAGLLPPMFTSLRSGSLSMSTKSTAGSFRARDASLSPPMTPPLPTSDGPEAFSDGLPEAAEAADPRKTPRSGATASAEGAKREAPSRGPKKSSAASPRQQKLQQQQQQQPQLARGVRSQTAPEGISDFAAAIVGAPAELDGSGGEAASFSAAAPPSRGSSRALPALAPATRRSQTGQRFFADSQKRRQLVGAV
mmetsp:Transcript_41366/g.110266  ORF Transcript_41366/g.110266 Transcript_41366/m.110266 type:complete len:526 (-) Transcript_41366:70-1647(-)